MKTALNGLTTVVGILCQWGYRVCGLCFDQGKVGIVFPEGFVRWIPEQELRYDRAPRKIAEDIVKTVPLELAAAYGDDKEQQAIVDVSVRELAWWMFLRELYRRGQITS